MSSILYGVVANILTLVITFVVVFLMARFIVMSKRAKLMNFLRISPENPEITVYLSAHKVIAQLPRIDIPTVASPDELPKELQKLREIQNSEDQTHLGESENPKRFTTVSAIEMIEFMSLKQEIEQPMLFDWFPHEIQAQLQWMNPRTRRIKVSLDACPDDYRKIKLGTIVLIGGPRANLGTFYFLFGAEAGSVRPKRANYSQKNTVEYIDDSGPDIIADPAYRNLGIIQRFKTNDRTIIYLAGTGVNGTAAAIAYLRMNWSKLQAEHGSDNFKVVIECGRREEEEEDLSTYLDKGWSNEEWGMRF